MKHETEIAVFVGAIRERKAEIDRLTKLNEAARKELEVLLLDRGSSWSDDIGYALISSEGERVSYDVKALDGLILADPLKYGWLHDYRRKSAISASLKVK